jgi:hypothetical protein
MKSSDWKLDQSRVSFGVVFCSLFFCLGSLATHAQTQASAGSTTASEKIAPGTILPVILRTGFSFDKAKPGQILHGEIAQDVSLGSGAKIHKGAKVEGQIAEVTPAAGGPRNIVKVQFDKVNVDGQWVPVVTNLRAIAGFMAVIDAGIPIEAPTEGSPYNWLPKEQIGGDTDYGVGGPVQSADGSKVIGKFLGNGVVGQVSAKEGSKCRGPVDNNNNPQALWVFSSEACGVYGIEHLQIEHAGRTDPLGTIVLASDTRNLKLRDGDGLLLRVN